MVSVTRDATSPDNESVGSKQSTRTLSVTRRAFNAVVAAGFQALLYICAVLPMRLVHFLARCVGWVAWHLRVRARRITERNISIALPHLSKSEQAELAKASFNELLCSVAWLGPSWLWPADRVLDSVSSIVGEEHLHDAVAEGRGVIVLLPHLGNWELLDPFLTSLYPLTTLYKEPRIPNLNKVFLRARGRHGNRLFPANKSGVRALFKALKASELVAILPDQIPTKEGGDFAPFFGEPALTMTLVTKLIQRRKSRAVCAFALRQPDDTYQINFRPADEGIYSSDCQTSLQALNKSVEQCVLECPEQYQWEYKRYKFLPDFSRRKPY